MGRLFGTDGVRGIANRDLTCELAMAIGRAAAMILTNGSRRRPLVVVATDTRISADMLSGAVITGLCSMGADVIRLGVMPTPAACYLVGRYKADAGIMITASHNPYEYNGIKIFSGDGYKLPDALEEQIEAIVLDHVEEPRVVAARELGKVTERPEAVKDYIDHLKSTVPYDLKGLRIAVDCANGAAGVTAGILFSTLGADCDILFDKPDGWNVNENCGSTHMETLSRYVVEHGLDCGIAFDGDADRCLAVDGTGEIVDGDQIMAICALDLMERGKLTGNTVVGTIMTNFGFSRFCEENGLRFMATKVGDRYVLEEMLQEDYAFGGEQSGHIIFRDFATTGDGQLTAIQLLSLLRRKGSRLEDLKNVMKRYPQVTVNLEASKENKLQFYTNDAIRSTIQEAKEALGDTGRVVVRPSGTEPVIRIMAEGDDERQIQNVVQHVAEQIRKELRLEV